MSFVAILSNTCHLNNIYSIKFKGLNNMVCKTMNLGEIQ